MRIFAVFLFVLAGFVNTAVAQVEPVEYKKIRASSMRLQLEIPQTWDAALIDEDGMMLSTDINHWEDGAPTKGNQWMIVLRANGSDCAIDDRINDNHPFTPSSDGGVNAFLCKAGWGAVLSYWAEDAKDDATRKKYQKEMLEIVRSMTLLVECVSSSGSIHDPPKLRPIGSAGECQ